MSLFNPSDLKSKPTQACPKKNETNLKKHGLALESGAAAVFSNPATITVQDNRQDYGEDRYVSIGKAAITVIGFTIKVPVLVVVWTFRGAGAIIRVISARASNKSVEEELKRYL
jgi:uncharacterized DUF497 family protein